MDVPGRHLAALVRALLLTACAGTALALPAPANRVTLALALLALGAVACPWDPRTARSWSCAEGGIAAAAVPWTGGEHSPLLPYLLAFGAVLGLTAAVLDLMLASCLALAALAASAELHGSSAGLLAGGRWTALSVAMGVLAVWSRHLVPADPAESETYRDVQHLLRQLRRLTLQLPGGLDAEGAAQDLLSRCQLLAAPDRGAVVVETGEGVFVPLAVVGAERVPWRTPVEQSGPLHRAWVTGRPDSDHRPPDREGRRTGGTLLALPLMGSEGAFGLVVLEASEPHQLALADDLAALVDLVARAAPQLETALLFEQLRREATLQERDRLAREMHDGIAQDLAVVGYQLDELRRRADPGLVAQVGVVRETVTSLISDLRLRITELRTSVHPDRGLGAALSTYLRAVCSGRGVVLTLALQENGFRLPVEQEVALLRVAQLFAQEARRSTGISELRLQLLVEAPSALMQLSCDVPLAGLRHDQVTRLLQHVPAEVLSLDLADDHTHLEITMKGTDHDERPAGRRPLAHSTGAPTGV